jgi:choice-of-anchor A domain-containing protein
MPRAACLAALLTCIIALPGAPARATELTVSDMLTQFNAVILGDFRSRHDVEGRLAVGGDLKEGATFYSKPSPDPSVFEAVNVAGNVSTGNYNINNGGNVVVGETNKGRFNLNGGGKLTVGQPNIVPADLVAAARATSLQLYGLAANSTINASDLNSVRFQAAPVNGLAVFAVTTAALETYRNIIFDLNDATTVIVNVSGAQFKDMANFNAGAAVNQHVLWNFADATRLDFRRSWHGSILAPDAYVTNSTAMEGTLIAGSFKGDGELHNYAFRGTLPSASVPEPGTFGILVIGLAGLVHARTARARRATASKALRHRT